MGWQSRGGREYYYRSKRVNGRVVNEYIGTGARAEEIVAEQKAKSAARQAIDAANEEAASISQHVIDVDLLADALATAQLLNEGFHRPRRKAWRRRTK